MKNPNRRQLLRAGVALSLPLDQARAHQAPLAPLTLTMTPVADGIYTSCGRHELSSPANGGHIANVSFIIGRQAVAVIDTGGSVAVGAGLRAAIAAATDLPVRYVINTHMHPDHTMGNAAFEQLQTTFVGHAKLPRALAARAARYLETARTELGDAAASAAKIVLPSLTVASVETLDLGGRTLTLTARKTAHTDNDLTIRDEATGTVFMGDLLFSRRIPSLDGSIRGWQAVLNELRSEPATRVVPGHGPASMPWPEAMAAEQGYLGAVTADVRTLIKAGRTLSEAVPLAAREQRPNWLLFDEFHPRNVTAAYAELEWE